MHDGTWNILSLQELPNGLILSGSTGGHLMLWNITNGTIVFPLLGHQYSNGIYGIQLFDDYTFASGSADKSIRIWNLTNGVQIQQFQNNAGISCLNKLRNGSLVSGDKFSNYTNHTVKIWNPKNGKQLNALYGHMNQINTLELVNDTVLASASDDGFVILWNLIDGDIIYKFNVSTVIWCLKSLTDFSLAAACNNGKIYIWNTTTGILIKTLNNGKRPIKAIDLYNDSILISGYEDASSLFSFKMWNIYNGNVLRSFTNDKLILCIKSNLSCFRTK